jgi:hypothetical protein
VYGVGVVLCFITAGGSRSGKFVFEAKTPQFTLRWQLQKKERRSLEGLDPLPGEVLSRCWPGNWACEGSGIRGW